jgi:CDP-diacylglycerol--glycerol-3-phosphate 3-phosphatidyltransferase
MLLTTPNVLTLCRIATAPLLAYLLLFTGPLAAIAAAAVFFVATITDFLDGYIARSYGSGTTLGKFLDPLADKLIITTALVMLAGMSRSPHVPAWMVVVLVAREMAVTGLRAIAAAEGEIIAADDLGKYKMALQCVAVQGLLIHYTFLHIDFFAAGMFVLWIAMVLSIWSGVEYFIKARACFTSRARPAIAKRAAKQ